MVTTVSTHRRNMASSPRGTPSNSAITMVGSADATSMKSKVSSPA